MIQLRRFLLIISILLISTTFLQAQEGKGQIQGTVKDSTTGDLLYGANVWLKGLSLGAATDLEGKYRINSVPAGSYTMVIRYIGYKQKEIPITVTGGRTLELNIDLPSEVIEGKPVVVTAQAVGQRGAINQQLTSNTIINVVSAEKIHELPDDNAATALSRLPGVSIMNGDQIVIRGVQAKLNQVLINGIQMPSTDMNDRATNLGFISSNMLSGIEVIKALTPDLDANTIGGVVNLRLREAPSGVHFDALAQGNYDRSDRNTNYYKFWASLSNRFFNDKLGVFLQGNADKSDGGNQRAARSLTLDGSANTAYGQGTYLTNRADFEFDRDIVTNGGGSLIMDYRLPNGKIVLQNTYAGNFTDRRNNMIQLDFSATKAVFTMDRNKYGKDLWINALQAENTFGNVKLEASLSHSSTEQYTRFAYEPRYPGTGWTDFENATDSIAPFGRDAQGLPIIYNSRAAQASMTMEKAYNLLDNLNPADIQRTTLEGWASSINNIFKQHLYNSSLDVTAPLNFSNNISATFKAGGKYVRTTRMNDFDRKFSGATDDDTYRNVLNFFPGRPRSIANRLKLTDVMETEFKRGKYFLNDEYDFKNGFQYVINTDIFDSWLRTSQTGWSPALKKDDSWKDDWNGSESFTAGYIMGTFNIFQDWTLLAGVRYERYNMNYHANFTYTIHNVYGDAISTEVGTIWDNPDTLYHSVPASWYNVDRVDINYFPDVHLKYKVNGWSDIRFAYTTGIARPDYLSIIPKVFVFPGNSFEVGNPKLRPTTAKNFDIIASIYNNEIGLLTIDGFYKELKDVMFTTGIYYGSLPDLASNVNIPDSAFMKDRFNYTTRPQDVVNTSLNNPNLGYIRGIEISWQTNFWYLPQPLNSLVLDINYTKSNSNMDYRIFRNVVTTIYDTLPSGRIQQKTFFSTNDTVFNGRLVQQANDVLNVALGVDYKGFSGRLSFNMRGNVLNSVGTRPEESSYTGNIYRWDFTLKQELPVDGLSIALNGINIFHNGIKSYRKYRVNPNAPITENLVSVLYPPTIFQANLRYSF